MPCEKAVCLRERLTGVHISEATARRDTSRAGEATLVVQQAPANDCASTSSDAAHPSTMIVSADGAMVPLVKGPWADVKTVVVGCVESKRPEEPVHSSQLSSFSRMVEAHTFTEQARGELLRRGVDQAEQVCAGMDGAEWIDGCVDWQCNDAVRILDGAHAAEDVSDIGHLAHAAGAVLPHDWLSIQLASWTQT